MTTRLEQAKVSSDAYAAMLGLEKALAKAGLRRSLIKLVYLHTSQISGCAYCMNIHTNDARKAGEAEQRLQALYVWQETPYLTPCERVAPAWTERLTRLSQGPLPHGLPDELREHFDDKEIVELILVVSAINAWNRFGVGVGMQSE